MSIARPVAAPTHGTNGRITQAFDGDYNAEPSGYIRTDLGVDRAQHSWFPLSRKRLHLHKAIDYATATGTLVYAVHDGEVVGLGQYGFTGEWYLAIRIKVGRTRQIVAFYTHLRHDSFRVRKGDKVHRGQVVAKTGNSGWSTGPHLHFELRRGFRWQSASFIEQYNNWMRFDPQPFINGKSLEDIV